MTFNHLGFAAFAAGLVAITSAMAVPAAGFDPHRCSAIQNVDVPYEVSIAGDRIAFTRGGRDIVVASAYMKVNGRRFADASLSPAYYRSIRSFLHSAGAFPKKAAEFGKTAFLPGQSDTKQRFIGSVTAMCHSILNLADDQKRMHAAFAGFVSPLEITTRQF